MPHEKGQWKQKLNVQFKMSNIMDDDPNKDDKGMTITLLGHAFELPAQYLHTAFAE